MVLTAYFVLSPAIGLSCHRRLARLLARLDASVGASGPHAFAVRASTVRLTVLPASTASRPASVTCATPLCGTGRGELVEMICPTGKAKYFCKGGWTANSLICPWGNQIELLEEISLSEQRPEARNKAKLAAKPIAA